MAKDPGIEASGDRDGAHEDRIRIGISSCLLGQRVRYDGGHKLDPFLTDTLGRYVEYVPVCPEVESGLPVPREAMHLQGDPSNPRLVTVRTGVDQTDRLHKWALKRVRELEDEKLSGFIFKGGSPSSGKEKVKVFNNQGQPSGSASGIFARVFMEYFPLVPVEEDGRLHDPALRENFIEAIFTLGRWRKLMEGKKHPATVVSFHTKHKLLVLSHSLRHYRTMGRLVAEGGEHDPEGFFTTYERMLVEAMNLKSTVKKNTNVLMHAMGYFKNLITRDEKLELLETIEHYRMERVPLVVPLTLLRHYIRKYDQPYLKEQAYFHPHPLEVLLRNHV